MKRTHWMRVVALLGVLALIVAACGGGRDDDSATDDTAEAVEDPGESTEDTGEPTEDTGEPTEDTGEPPEEAADTVIDRAACEGTNLTQGIEDNNILIGTSRPNQGLFAVFDEIRKGYEAYFNFRNAETGGLDIGGESYTVSIVAEDDEYDPALTQEKVRKLLADGVFGFLTNIGTPNNLAIRGDLEEQCVPNLFVGTGSQLWGDPAFRFTVGSIPSYALESALFVEYLLENHPTAKVGILAQNDDFGFGYVDGLKIAIEGTDIEIVTTETYEPSESAVDTQITSLAASGADTFLLAGTVLACPSAVNKIADTDWDPVVMYISATCSGSATLVGIFDADKGAGEGAISTAYLLQPASPAFAENPATEEFRVKAAEYGPAETDVTDGLTVYGWTMGELLATTLEEVGARGLPIDRVSAAEVANTLDGVQTSLVVPGITFTTGPGDHYPTETLGFTQFTHAQGYFDYISDPIDFEGRSGEFVESFG